MDGIDWAAELVECDELELAGLIELNSWRRRCCEHRKRPAYGMWDLVFHGYGRWERPTENSLLIRLKGESGRRDPYWSRRTAVRADPVSWEFDPSLVDWDWLNARIDLVDEGYSRE